MTSASSTATLPVSAPPPPAASNPVKKVISDLRYERAATVPFPPGPKSFSMARTMSFTRDPLRMMLDSYERYGPVFTLRLLHANVVIALGPEANHHMLVSNASNFSWRDGSMGDLMPLLGDGLLTIDGEFHRRSRKAMLPHFHREKIALARDVMAQEIDTALEGWVDGLELDLYDWTRHLALRIAMRALFGLDPDSARGEIDAAHEFETALSFWSRDFIVQVLRGPATPWARMIEARKRLDRVVYGELRRRRAEGRTGDDLIGLLLEAQDSDGLRLTDSDIRDEVMTLMFAGHDTTTSTIAFLFYELGRNPRLADAPDFDLGLALEETLRMYPPAWVGPRRSIEPFEVCGVPVPGGAPVNYSSWASHHLPDVWGDPEVFRPSRMSGPEREALPKGAYVPFGGGSRTCIGMRFGEAEIEMLAARILSRFRLELSPGYQMRVRQMPTIGPKFGLPVTVRSAPPAAGLQRPAETVA